MGIEIERKFLITSTSFKESAHQKKEIKQGFLNSDKNRVVRVRVYDEDGYLTIKGPSNTSGTSRYEWEQKIPKKEALQLLNLCEEGIIEKERYLVCIGVHTYEIDVFFGDNEGLIVAEIELSEENEEFLKPSWLGREVTGVSKYYNSNLSKKPFNRW